MPEAQDAPISADEAKARAMLAELIEGDREVSQSEPTAPVAEGPEAPGERQADEAEASSQTDEATDEAPTQETDGDESEAPPEGLDLEWIDAQDSDYAELLSSLHQEGHLSEEALAAARQAYMPRKGMYKAQEKAAAVRKELEEDAKIGRELKDLFESDAARRDFLEWKQTRGQPQARSDDVETKLKERLKTALENGDDEDLIAAMLETSKEIAKHQHTSTAQAEAEARQSLAEYEANFTTWAQEVKQEFTDELGASEEEIQAAADVLAGRLARRQVNVMDVIQSASDLKDEMQDIVNRIHLENQLKSVVGRRDSRSKQYDGKTLKASSAPAVSAEVDEDLSTPQGRIRAIENDADIQALWSQLQSQ